MTAHRGRDIKQELALCLRQVNNQMEEIRQEAERTGIAPVTMRDANGNYIWAPLVVAKAQVLHALVLVNQS
jgi:hypothetical protein